MLMGQRLKNMRIEKKMSQQDLGDALGITKVSICGYENGTRTPSLETLCSLAKVFGVSTDYLLGMEVPIACEDNGEYIGAISREDIELIFNLRHYPTLYTKMSNDSKRYIALINKKMR